MILSQIAKRFFSNNILRNKFPIQSQFQLTYQSKNHFISTSRKEEQERINVYLNQMNNNLIQENDFDNKYKQEKNLVLKFIRKRAYQTKSPQTQADQQSEQNKNSTPKKQNDKLTQVQQQQQIEYLPQQVYKMHHLLLIAYMLKKDIKPTEQLNIFYFYKNEFLQNDQYQSIVRTLRDLTEKDLRDFILYSVLIIFKDPTLKLQANQKFDIINNFIQLGMHQFLHLYIKQLLLSIEKEDFAQIKAWKPILTLNLMPKLIKHCSLRDMDYMNEQLCNILITKTKYISPFFLIELCNSIFELCQVSSKSPFPFKNLIKQLQQHVLDLVNNNDTKDIHYKAKEVENIIKKPKFIMNFVKIIKFNQDINVELVNQLESILASIKPHFNHFKSHMLFFNSLSVINSGEIILKEITKQIADKNSKYYEEACEYEIKYILKLMFNEQLLIIQKQTENIWKNDKIYAEDIKDITLFTETQLFKSFDEIVSMKINSIDDINKFDVQTQLIFRRLYGMLYKSNKKLSSIAEFHNEQNQTIFSKELSHGPSINEFNSDVQVYMNEHNIEYEAEKYIGYRYCDVFVPSLNLVIELDGKYHNQDIKLAKDQFRNISYLKLGYKLLEINIMQWEMYRLNGKINQVLDEKLSLFKNNPDIVMVSI